MTSGSLLGLAAQNREDRNPSDAPAYYFTLPVEESNFEIKFDHLGLPADSKWLATHEGAFGTVVEETGGVSFHPTATFWEIGVDSFAIQTTSSEAPFGPVWTKVLVSAGMRGERVFEDDFEVGAVGTRGPVDATGKLSLTSAAALAGQRGLQLEMDELDLIDAYLSYAVDRMPPDPKGDPNDGGLDLKVDPGGGMAPIQLPPIALLQGTRPSSYPAPASFNLEVQGEVVAGYSLRAVAYDSLGSYATSWHPVGPGAHRIRLDWWSEEDTGFLLRIDDRNVGLIRGLVDPLALSEIRVGGMNVTESATGEIFFDDLHFWSGDYRPAVASVIQDSVPSLFANAATWTGSFVGGGSLERTAAAALMGAYGLEVGMEGSSHVFLESSQPAAERMTARFRFDPNSVDLGADRLILFAGYGVDPPVAQPRIQLRLRQQSGQYQIRLDAWESTGHRSSPWVPLGDFAQDLTLQWWSPEGADAQAGKARLWVNAKEVAEISGLLNIGHRVETVRIGALGIDSVYGHFYFDEIEIWE